MKDIIKVLVLMALLAIAVLQSGYHTNSHRAHAGAASGINVQNDAFTTNPGKTIALPVLANDKIDTENSTLVFSQPAHGTIQSAASGRGFVYVPKKGFSGQDGFVYKVCLNEACKSALVTVTVSGTGN